MHGFLNMLMMNFWCLLTIPVLWVVVGFLVRGRFTSAGAFPGRGQRRRGTFMRHEPGVQRHGKLADV